MNRSTAVRHALLGLAVLGCVAYTAASPPLPQTLTYHLFADTRSWFGVANTFDVLSNLPFAVIGLVGLSVTLSWSGAASPFREGWERWPYAALFVGVACTSLGSGYYHLAPDNARLVWDRLPMAIGFMGLLTAIVAERLGLRVARWLFVPLLIVGAGSVWYWRWTELQHAGDLRLYLLVQFGSLIAVFLLMALYPTREAGTRYLVAGLIAYAAAKGLELADQPIFAAGHVVSGHTLKHLAAAVGVLCLVKMLRVRAERNAERGRLSS